MGNFLPCLAHGAINRPPMSSKAAKQKLNRFGDPVKLLHKWKKAKSRVHTTNTGDAAEPVSEDDLEKGEKGFIRVKVVLTKEEAARLLSMCIRGEEKTLVQLMISRVESRQSSAGTLGSSHGGWRPVLESIPEDC